MPRSRAAAQVGVNIRTARDWDKGVVKSHHTRTYPDGRRVDYTTGQVTMVAVKPAGPGIGELTRHLDPRYLTVQEREKIADLRREGASIRAIARTLARPASTIKRELDTHSDATGRYRAYEAHRAWTASRARPKPSKLCQRRSNWGPFPAAEKGATGLVVSSLPVARGGRKAGWSWWCSSAGRTCPSV